MAWSTPSADRRVSIFQVEVTASYRKPRRNLLFIGSEYHRATSHPKTPDSVNISRYQAGPHARDRPNAK